MNTEEKAKAYDKALEKAKKELNACGSIDCDAARQIFRFFPELREEEKPLTPFQQCLNCILRGVYYAEVPDEKVNEFILNVVRTRTDELIKLAKRHEDTDCQLRENEDERIRKALIDALKVSETIGELKFRLPYPTREECIAYLEKQKEQKPNIELIQRSWYMEGYNDREFGKEPKWILKTGEGGPKHELNPKYGQPLADEQKPVLTAKEAWKEMRLEVYAQASGNRHEPNYSDDSTKMFSLCDIDEIFEKIGNSTVEQKSAEWSEEDKEALDMCLDVIPKKWKTKSGILLTKWLKDNIHLQPKQEWSEEDADILNCCISSIEEAKENRYAYKETDGDTSYDREIAWLKSLRPQPREEIYQSAKHDLAIKFMNYLDENRPEGKMSLSNGECEDIDKAFKENDWAKIMRYVEKYSPQPKVVWSEEDESILDALIYDIERLPMQGVLTHRPCDSYIKFLKALRPGWKPTEEQMKALQHAIDACESEWAYQDDELRSLLNDLKKL